MEDTPKAVKPVVHGGYPDAAEKPYPGPIILQIAKAIDDHDKWDRRHAALLNRYRGNHLSFADRDGIWSLNVYLDYVGQAAFGIRSAS